MKSFCTDPEAIESKSMAIIENTLGQAAEQFDPKSLTLVKRVIHTTADFEYADLMAISPGAIEAGIAELSEGGQVLVADTNMICAGINKAFLQRFGARAECLVALQSTREEALKHGLTRSMVNIRRAVEIYPKALYIIGNAPTALYELLRLYNENKVEPALVVGVPVGFVEAEESKEELLGSKVPHITVRGRKGGSTVAVAIVNGLLKLASKGVR